MLKCLLASNFLIAVIASQFAFAYSFTSNKTGGNLTSIITMTVNTPTCVIQPYDNIDFERIIMTELLGGARNLTANISFECETTRREYIWKCLRREEITWSPGSLEL